MRKNTVLNLALLLVSILVLVPVGFLILFLLENSDGIVGVRVTNISSNSATISWATNTPLQGKVYISSEDWIPSYAKYFKPDTVSIFYDDRDVEEMDGQYNLKSNTEERYTHHVTIRDLKPDTQYYFRIAGRNKAFSKSISGFKTYQLQQNIQNPEAMYGTVSLGGFESSPIEDGIVFYRFVNYERDTQSILYSSLIDSETSNWTGSIRNIVSAGGDTLQIDPENFFIEGNVETKNFSLERFEIPLDEYKPLQTIEL